MRYLVLLISNFLLGCADSDNGVELLTASQARHYVIAHRGSWKLHNLPQNSIASLREALSLQIYGTEFDVHQTKDSVLVVNHDNTFNEIEISNATYNELSIHTLRNGEIIPTLDDFFSLYKSQQSDVKLFVELKQCDVKKVVNLVERYNIQDNVEYLSFCKSYCDQLVQLGLGKYVLYLGGNLSPDDVSNLGYGGISYNEPIFNKHIEWLSDAKRIGLNICVWPIDAVEKMKLYIDKDIRVSTDNPTMYNISK